MNNITKVLKEAIQSVLPIFAIVLVLSVSVAPMESGLLVMFLFGTLLLIVGMGFFTIGSGISMEPLGEGIGSTLGKAKKIIVPLIVCFVLGIIITIAEPDLSVLADQVSIDSNLLKISIAVGVGLFLVISMVRSRRGFKLNSLLLVFYIVVIVLAIALWIMTKNEKFIPTAFDSGGVTTGPITVPFIMALGAGMASISTAKNARENSFGLIALCSIGPILSVLILSLIFQPEGGRTEIVPIVPQSTLDAFKSFIEAFPKYLEEVSIAIAPIVAVMIIYQLITKKFNNHQMIRMIIGFVYTYIGLVLFLTGANVGFMPAGSIIGARIAESDVKFLLIPIGTLMGYFVVSAEPAVHSLKKQVEEITNGSVSQKSIGLALSIGVAISVSIAMLRVVLGISILPILIVGYSISLIISFYVPPIYTGIAFDSGGVASGPMATTFILPFAIGACEVIAKAKAVGMTFDSEQNYKAFIDGQIMTDAFGIVAMIAMTPLIAIQVLGLIGQIKHKKQLAQAKQEILSLEDDMIYYEEVA